MLKFCHELRSTHSASNARKYDKGSDCYLRHSCSSDCLKVLVRNTEYNQTSDIKTSFKISLKDELKFLLD